MGDDRQAVVPGLELQIRHVHSEKLTMGGVPNNGTPDYIFSGVWC